MSTNQSKDDHHYSYFIIGLVASIFLYVSLWELLVLIVPKNNKVLIYSIIFLFSLGVLCWLANIHPSIIGR
jgi:hypothetical protein